MKVRFQADADLNHIIVLAVLRHEPAVEAAEARLSPRSSQAASTRPAAIRYQPNGRSELAPARSAKQTANRRPLH